MIVNKKVENFDIFSVSGNAFAIMGGWQRAALREGWTREEVNKVITEAKSGGYDHLLATIQNHTE